MKIRDWLLAALLAGTVAFWMGNVRADMGGSFQPHLGSAASGTFETTLITANTASAGSFGTDSILFGFKIYVDAGSDTCGLYDTASLLSASATQGIFIDEGGEATAGDVWQSSWPGPYRLVTDLTVVTNSPCVIYHEVQT